MRYLLGVLVVFAGNAASICAQQTPENFRWVDFHASKEADTIAWVTRSLATEPWTAIREIGVEYDAALVVTSTRSTPQSAPADDTFTVWSVSLTSHTVTPLLKGANLLLMDWMLLVDGAPRELGAIYDDCNQCQPQSFFTTFHYDLPQHMWTTRWMRGAQAVPIWTVNPPAGAALTQLYAVFSEPNGRQFVATWSHIDHGKEKPSDTVFRYDIDPRSGLDRMELISNREAEALELRLCSGQGAVPGLERGQDSALCQLLLKPHPVRRPVTTPPANNHGQSQPPSAHR